MTQNREYFEAWKMGYHACQTDDAVLAVELAKLKEVRAKLYDQVAKLKGQVATARTAEGHVSARLGRAFKRIRELEQENAGLADTAKRLAAELATLRTEHEGNAALGWEAFEGLRIENAELRKALENARFNVRLKMLGMKILHETIDADLKRINAADIGED